MKTTYVTPQMAKVRELADEVLNTVEGITVTFSVERYGNLHGSHAAARGMQIAFSGLRARERRLSARRAGVPDYERDGFIRGPYDGIACELRPMPRDAGHQIIFTPGSAWGMDFEVTDNKTGLPLERINPTEKRAEFLLGRAIHEQHEAAREKRPLRPIFDEEEREFLWANFGDMCAELRIGKPQSMIDAEMPDRPESDYSSVDLADLDESELEIVNPEPGE